MGRAHVKVFVRTRPTAHDYEGLKVLEDKQSLVVHIPKDQAHDVINNKTDNLSFKYDGVLESVSQESVYSCCGQEVVEGVLAGYNGTIMCYGQTGAGKTFTMAGELRNYSHRGLVPRAIQHLFREMGRLVDRCYKVQASFLEVYNEALYDLLSPQPAANEHLTVLEDAGGQTFVRGLTWQEVPSEEAALAAFFAGHAARSTAAHALNAASSRSHCVFSLRLEMRSAGEGAERAVASKLHLVDLAGSERTKKTGAAGAALAEANSINRSLSFLEQAVQALGRRGAHVPYRQSKLTAVLADALGGGCRTTLIANVWNEAHHLEETLSTLRFASRMRCLEVQPVVVEVADPAVLLRRYERQVRELRQELAMRDALSGRGRINYEDLSAAELAELREAARRYLGGQADESALPCDTIKRIREVWRAMRSLYLEAAAAGAGGGGGGGSGAAGASDGSATDRRGSVSEQGAVGELDRFGGAQGFAVGMAPSDSRPAAPPGTADAAAAQQRRARIGPGALSIPGAEDGSRSASPAGGLPSSPSLAALAGADGSTGLLQGGLSRKGSLLAELVATAGGAGSERNALFLRFKHEAPLGQQLNVLLKAQQQQLKEAKVAARDLSMVVNEAKQDIELAQQQAQQQQAHGQQEEGGAAEERLAAARAAYRSSFDQLKTARSRGQELELAVAELREQQVLEFEAWAAAQGLLQPASPSYAHQGASIPAYHPLSSASTAAADGMDPAEAFDLAERQRLVAKDPDSCAYHSALKRTLGAGGGRH